MREKKLLLVDWNCPFPVTFHFTGELFVSHYNMKGTLCVCAGHEVNLVKFINVDVISHLKVCMSKLPKNIYYIM